MKHKVSIIMSVLNGERYIDEAIRSILAQTYKNYELIVINDGSTDSTCQRLDSYRDKLDMKVIHHPTRRGITISTNDGIRSSTGDSISFLDHDDVWLPQMLETQVSHLQKFPDVGMVHSDFQTIDPEGKIVEESVARCRNRRRPSGHVFRELFMDSFIVAISVLVRKECFDRLGGWDESLRWGDYHMWLRIARHYKIDYVPEVLVKYRQHPSQNTRPAENGRMEEDPVAISVLNNILEHYPEARQEFGEKVIRRRLAEVYFGGAYYYFDHGMFQNARMYLARAIPLWPTNSRYYLMYSASLLGPTIAGAGRAAWHWGRSILSPGSRHSTQWRGQIQEMGNNGRN
jgi:glycosyltransferase involved in cell wall biosynthesis